MDPGAERGAFGQEMDDASDRVRPVEDRGRTSQDFDLVDIFGTDERGVGARPPLAFKPGPVDKIKDPPAGQSPDGGNERKTSRTESAHAGDVLDPLRDVGGPLFRQRFAPDDGFGGRDLDRRLGVAESRHRDLLALRDQGSERENELPGQLRPGNRELALVVVRVDDLEADPAGAGDRENEFAAGTGYGPRAGRTVADHSSLKRLAAHPDHHAPDLGIRRLGQERGGQRQRQEDGGQCAQAKIIFIAGEGCQRKKIVMGYRLEFW